MSDYQIYSYTNAWHPPCFWCYVLSLENLPMKDSEKWSLDMSKKTAHEFLKEAMVPDVVYEYFDIHDILEDKVKGTEKMIKKIGKINDPASIDEARIAIAKLEEKLRGWEHDKK